MFTCEPRENFWQIDTGISTGTLRCFLAAAAVCGTDIPTVVNADQLVSDFDVDSLSQEGCCEEYSKRGCHQVHLDPIDN